MPQRKKERKEKVKKSIPPKAKHNTTTPTATKNAINPTHTFAQTYLLIFLSLLSSISTRRRPAALVSENVTRCLPPRCDSKSVPGWEKAFGLLLGLGFGADAGFGFGVAGWDGVDVAFSGRRGVISAEGREEEEEEVVISAAMSIRRAVMRLRIPAGAMVNMEARREELELVELGDDVPDDM
ncbi:hypothetical protein RUND412_000202 [Rhizina undulata]